MSDIGGIHLLLLPGVYLTYLKVPASINIDRNSVRGNSRSNHNESVPPEYNTLQHLDPKSCIATYTLSAACRISDRNATK